MAYKLVDIFENGDGSSDFVVQDEHGSRVRLTRCFFVSNETEPPNEFEASFSYESEIPLLN